MTYPYTINTGIPNAPNNPTDDQPEMKTNFANISGFLGVDHVTPGSTNAGYHQIVHWNTQISDPSVITSIGQLYTKSVTLNSITDTQLFFESGGGTITQLTFPSSRTSNGYSVLPGGIILQWGIVNTLASYPSLGTVSFSSPNFTFPNNIFNIQCTLISKAGGTSSANTIAPITGTIGTDGFDYNYTGSTSYVGMYWFAIGN